MGSQQNIRNNYTRGVECRLLTDKYYDYMLYKGSVESLGQASSCLSAFVNLNDERAYLPGDKIASVVQWDGAKASDFSLENVGFTAMDNGLIQFDKDEITEEDFNELLLLSQLDIKATDLNLVLSPVSGNTKEYTYDYKFDEDDENKYVSLNGGFFQGFFKVPDEEYQTLPSYIDEDWHFEFIIRPKSAGETTDGTLNAVHPENKGIFFYIGTRAENKFNNISKEQTTITVDGEEIDIAEEKNTQYVTTDNKHLFFNRTKTGMTVSDVINDHENLSVTLESDEVKEYKDNAFKLFHRADGGYIASEIRSGKADDIYAGHDDGYRYDNMKDIMNNAFALKYNEDGSVSYKYTAKDCDAEDGWSLLEESTNPGLIEPDRWNIIDVRFAILEHALDNCGRPLNLGRRKMKIMIYVNGYLALVSHEMAEFNFRKLNVNNGFQETVPFNISLGGGTQGLADMITMKYKEIPTEHYYLENNYAGSFIGDIRSFRMYTCMRQFMDIHNTFIDEIGIIDDKRMKKNLFYYGFGSNVEDVIDNGKTLVMSAAIAQYMTDVASDGKKQFYMIMSKDSDFRPPKSFTMNAFPIEIEKIERKIGNTPCIVYKTMATYGVDTELTISALKI